MFRNKKLEQLQEELVKVNFMVEKTNDTFNKVHELLFSGRKLSADKLIELRQILEITGTFAVNRIEKFYNGVRKLAKRNIIIINIMMAISMLTFFISFSFPPIFLVNFIPIGYIFLSRNEQRFVIEHFIKTDNLFNKVMEFGSKLENYSNVISSRLEKVEVESISEVSACFDILGRNAEFLLESISYINDLIDEKIELKDIPEKYHMMIKYILMRDLGREATNLEVLLNQAKAEFNKNIQERVRER